MLKMLKSKGKISHVADRKGFHGFKRESEIMKGERGKAEGGTLTWTQKPCS